MEVGQISYNHEKEQYELLGEQLHCGQCIQVLICNGLKSGTAEWIDTRFELDGDNKGYLVGLIGYQISGLFAKRI